MKKILTLLSLIVSLSMVYPQTTDIYSIKVSKIDWSILEVSQSTLDILQSNGLKFQLSQYYNFSDWDNDGLEDLVQTVGQEELINSYLSLFKQKIVDGKIKFVEDPNYLMNLEGRPIDWSQSVGDLNGDNLLDIVVGTENYHGPDGQQPYYFEERKMWTTSKVFINNGNGFDRIELDTAKHDHNGIQEYWMNSGLILLDWDLDGKLEILGSVGGAKNNGYYRISEDKNNPANDKLLVSYELDESNNISIEFVFDWNLENEWINVHALLMPIINDKLYVAARNGWDKAWDTVNSVYVSDVLRDDENVMFNSEVEVLIFDWKQSFGEKSLEKRITLDKKKKGGGMIYQYGFHPADIDKDGNLEYVSFNWVNSTSTSGEGPFINVFDDDGTDITEEWLGDNYADLTKKNSGNGGMVLDMNSDGYPDIVPKDGWRYDGATHDPPRVEGMYGTFAIFINDGTKFNQYNLDFTDYKGSGDWTNAGQQYPYGKGWQGFRVPVDFDKDGFYEILIFDDWYHPRKMDILTLDYKNRIDDLSDVSIKEDSIKVIKLSAADLKGGTISYSAKSSENNVTAAISNDTLTLTPALNWHGNAQITAYASGSPWKDSTTFKLTVTPVSDIAAVQDVTIDEDKSTEVTLTSTFTGTTTFSAVSDTNAVTASVTSSTLTLTPSANWHGVANIKAYASDGSSKDSTAFKLTVTPIQDLPTAFEWVSSALDTINIMQENLETEYIVDWTASMDVDGDTIDYLLYAKIGVNPPEEIYDTTSTSVPITYLEFLENVFEPFPMLPRVTVQFSLEATDGIDTVKITGDNRVLFINRYAYLSTVSDGIPTEFALHENYPNPFNPTTTLRFDLPELSDMTLIIYNMLGQKVKTFNMQSTPAGYHSVTWDATNDLGQQVGAGVYLYQLQAKDFVKTRKMVLLK